MDNPENINPIGSNMWSASKARVELDSGEICGLMELLQSIQLQLIY